MKPNNWLARLVIATWAGHIAIFTFLAPESLSAQAIQKIGPMGYILLVALTVVAMLGMADNAVNDWLPERFKLRTKEFRHVGFMAMAITLVMLGGLVASKTGLNIILIAYLPPAFFSVVVTWTDMFARRREARQCP